jgi:hypothetical protein
MPRSNEAVRVSEVHLDSGGLRQRLVARHLAPVVVRHAQAQGRIESVEHKAKALPGVLSRGVVQRHQDGEQGLALYQGSDLRLVSRHLG